MADISIVEKGAGPNESAATNTAAIQSAIAEAITTGNRVVFPTNTYRVETLPQVSQFAHLHLDGFGSTLVGSPGFRFGVRSFEPAGAENLVVNNLTFESTESGDNAVFLMLSGVHDFRITNCEFRRHGNGGVLVEYGSEGGVLERCRFQGAIPGTARAIWFAGGDVDIVDFDTLRPNERPTDFGAKDVQVVNCVIDTPGYGIYSHNSRNIVIRDCVLRAKARCIAFNMYSPNCVVESCSLSWNGDRGDASAAGTGILVSYYSHDIVARKGDRSLFLDVRVGIE